MLHRIPVPANMSTRASARHATGRSPTTTARPAWPGRFSAPPPRTPSKTIPVRTRFLSRVVRHSLLDDPTRRRILSAALADRLRWQGNQRGRAEGRLRPGLGQPCAILPASHTAAERSSNSRWAGIPDPKRRKLGACRRAPIPIIRGPAASSPTSACSAITGFRKFPPGNEAPGSDPVFLGRPPRGHRLSALSWTRRQARSHRRKRAAAKVADIRASIVNPARLSPKLAMEVCMQCHLETTSGRIPAVIQRFNRGPFSFIPGEPLENSACFPSIMRRGRDTTTKFEAVSSVYRLRQSSCFTESEGKLTCQTCHNPHRVPRGAEAVTHYSAICRQCHTTRQGSIAALDSLVSSGSTRPPPTASPATCRSAAPRIRRGMIMTDHLIQRRPPPGDLLAELPRAPARRVSRRGRALLSFAASANRRERAVSWRGAGRAWETISQPACRNWRAKSKSRSPAKPSSTSCWAMPGETPASTREAVAAYEQAVRLNPAFGEGVARAGRRAERDAGNLARPRKYCRRRSSLRPPTPKPGTAMECSIPRPGARPTRSTKIRKAIALDPSLAGEIAKARRDSGEGRTTRSRPGRLAGCPAHRPL